MDTLITRRPQVQILPPLPILSRGYENALVTPFCFATLLLPSPDIFLKNSFGLIVLPPRLLFAFWAARLIPTRRDAVSEHRLLIASFPRASAAQQQLHVRIRRGLEPESRHLPGSSNARRKHENTGHSPAQLGQYQDIADADDLDVQTHPVVCQTCGAVFPTTKVNTHQLKLVALPG